LDFQADALADGRRFRVFAVVDDFTRECLALVGDTSLPRSQRVVRELDAIVAPRGRPAMCISDNGTELTTQVISMLPLLKRRYSMQCPVLETGTSCGNALDLRARLAFGTKRPRRRARRRVCVWIGQRMPPLGSGESAATLSVADGCRWPGGDRSSMPTWYYDSMVNIAHSQRFEIAVKYCRRRNACGY
jgi:hypothetical protein